MPDLDSARLVLEVAAGDPPYRVRLSGGQVAALLAELLRLEAVEYAARLFISEAREFARSDMGVPMLTDPQMAVVDLLEADLNAAEQAAREKETS